MRQRTTSDGANEFWRRLLAGLAAAQALAVLGQAWLAGGFLTGVGAALDAHRNMAFGVIQWIALFALIAAIAWWRPARGPAWPIAATALSLLAIGAQIAVGFANQLAVHIPLGVSIFGLNLWLATAVSRYERKRT